MFADVPLTNDESDAECQQLSLEEQGEEYRNVSNIKDKEIRYATSASVPNSTCDHYFALCHQRCYF